MTLDDHTDVPMSLLCWDQYLLSCSLDQTVKVWVATEAGNLEVAYTHNEDHVCVNFFFNYHMFICFAKWRIRADYTI